MKKHLLTLIISVGLVSCIEQEIKRFKLLKSDETGVTFVNRLTETPEFNIFTYLYFYNGGGVAAGDVNNDGWLDLYFTSNQEENKLYLNKGSFQFEDITVTTKMQGKKGWTTGVAMADVNGDGKLDIYVSQLGDFQNIRGKNQLYINQGNDADGIPQFEDKAFQYGLDLVGFSTQAAFFDYDLDGDLDMYMLNHSVHSQGTFGKSEKRKEANPLSGDKLLRNDSGHFTDVTAQSGIYSSVLGYGLGISTGDVNWDGYPDLYIGNDFHENDYLYINNGDGTFSEKLEDHIMHTSRFSMGNDIKDINNDGLPDILSLDMLPDDPVTLKASAAEDPYDIYNFKLNFGYNHQFARNTLQLNRGNGKFSEIGALSGIYATDWSWSGLIADLDLDGNKDIFVANGIKRRSNDLDYISFVSNDAIQYRLEGNLDEQDLHLIEKMPAVKVPNYAFQNMGGLLFESVADKWGLSQTSFSNGAAYADLDNDGDLDLVVNNIEDEAFIFQNNTKGKGKNTFGIGSKLIITTDTTQQTYELFPTCGYQSSVDPTITIGLAQVSQISMVTVIWPDHTFEVIENVIANQTIILDQNNARGKYNFLQPSNEPLYSLATDSIMLDYKHKENKFVEFTREPLLPHMNSTEGPKLAIGDVDGNGLEDLFVGGAKRQPAVLFLQTCTGFKKTVPPSFRNDSTSEDVGATFIDIDQDEDLDLIVVSGGNEFSEKSPPLLPRLYINDGKGNLQRNWKRLPEIFLTGSCVASGDFDRDGDMDLFIGGRAVPWKYGQVPSSYLLENDGKGYFKDVTIKKTKGLEKIGFVKDAQWADLNEDGYPELVVAGEWMPISIMRNTSGNLNNVTATLDGLVQHSGWWNTIKTTDLDGDGDMDIVAGNLGLNSKLKASRQRPVEMYVSDFDKNGSLEQLLCYYDKAGVQRLFATKDEITQQLVQIKKKYIRYNDYAKASIDDIIDRQKMKGAHQFQATEFRSGSFINNGNLSFSFHPFPIEAQFSPINAFYLTDNNKDGNIDLISGGNFYEVNIQLGRYDGSFGTLMLGNGDGTFDFVPNAESGLTIEGQVRDIQSLVTPNDEKLVIFARNNQNLLILKTKKPNNTN